MRLTPILICAIVIIFIQCAKEFSCEGCLGWPIVPSRDTLRTIPNELLARCSVFINDESLVRKVYMETTAKDHPNTFVIFDSLKLDGRKQYDTTINLKNYLDLTQYSIGDTFFYQTEIRWRFTQATYENIDTLIY